MLRKVTYLYISLLAVSILDDFRKMLNDVNPHAQIFNDLGEWVVNDSYRIPYKMGIYDDKRPSTGHQRKCNVPEASEVEASFQYLTIISFLTEIPFYNFVRYKCKGKMGFKEIHFADILNDPLACTLLFKIIADC